MSVVLITGCSTGIGLATAIHLAKEGHKVYASMRNPANSSLPEIIKKELLPIDILSLDVNNDESVQKAVKQVLDQEGRVDVLVNNAGIAHAGPVEELSLLSFQQDMETNYFGALRCIKAVLPSMREKGKGLIINVTSIAGRIFGHFHGSYCASKAAVEAFSECLAQEVEPFGLRVALVEPGVIETPIFSKGELPAGETSYPNIKRFFSFFAASLENRVQPVVVATVIGDVIDGKSTKFRNPAGPDAFPLLQWRASLPDEEWTALNRIDDETWINGMEAMQLNVKTYMENPSLIDFSKTAAVQAIE